MKTSQKESDKGTYQNMINCYFVNAILYFIAGSDSLLINNIIENNKI
jgi:hypothetical protein